MCGCGRKPRLVVVKVKGRKVDTCDVRGSERKPAGESGVNMENGNNNKNMEERTYEYEVRGMVMWVTGRALEGTW